MTSVEIEQARREHVGAMIAMLRRLGDSSSNA